MAATPLGRHFPIPGFWPVPGFWPRSPRHRLRSDGSPVLSSRTMSLLPAGSPSTEGVTMSNRSFEGLDATLGAMHLRPPTVVSADDTLAQVASAMVRDGVSCAILEEQPLRVVTEFDLARGLAQGLGPEDPVATIASAHPSWAPPSASVAEAAALDGQPRHPASRRARHLRPAQRPRLHGRALRRHRPLAGTDGPLCEVRRHHAAQRQRGLATRSTRLLRHSA